MNEDDLLLKVYIGQDIHFPESGILYKFNNKLQFDTDEKASIESLFGKNS